MEALLKVKNLSIDIRRGENRLSSVKEVSFEIYPGEILGIAGESGSGKSLTSLSILGLLDEGKEVSSGEILFHTNEEQKDGKAQYLDLLTLSQKDLEGYRGKEISMIFQETFSALNPLAKIGSQIAEALEIHGEKNKVFVRERVIKLLTELNFNNPENLMEAYPHQLSGGMCQRVMIAMAVLCRPRILIADEPTTALDEGTQVQILSLLKRINLEYGTSILFISHDLSLIRNFSSRVLFMYSGRILEEGDTEEVFSHPANEYTRRLIGAIPNRGNRGNDLVSIPGRIPSLEEGRPRGCPFHPRCVKSRPLCSELFPEETKINFNHKAHCVLAGSPGSGE